MSLLNKVQTGRKLKPLAIMLHAPHGIGKSTFATEAPNPIYIGNEENDELDVSRFPKVKVWQDLLDQLKTLRDEKHDYKTIVIDTVDGLEQVAEQFILSLKGAEGKSMATAFGGYGKAYKQMNKMFLDLKDDYLVPLRDINGMNMVLLCHSKKVKFEDTMLNLSYDHYETNIHKDTKALFEDWVSAILFANYFLVRAENNSGKEYAEGVDGMRMIYTEERPSHIAKNRFNMPYDIKNHVLAHFAKKKKEAVAENKEFNDEADDLKKQIKEKLPKLSDELKVAVETSLKRAKDDVKELKRIIKKINGALA